MKRFKLGLTGSIGMGKSTTAQMFQENGCDVWDADAAVSRLYRKDGAAVPAIGALVPAAIEGGAVCRKTLRAAIAQDGSLLKKIEAVVHPLVAQDRMRFLTAATSDIVVFDIPLLFETGGDAFMDAVACVDVLPDIQEERVMSRGTMTREQFLAIRDKQMPNSEKCARSDFVITTDSIDHAQLQVQAILKNIRNRLHA